MLNNKAMVGLVGLIRVRPDKSYRKTEAAKPAPIIPNHQKIRRHAYKINVQDYSYLTRMAIAKTVLHSPKELRMVRLVLQILAPQNNGF